jgi:hypothetical protein
LDWYPRKQPKLPKADLEQAEGTGGLKKKLVSQVLRNSRCDVSPTKIQLLFSMFQNYTTKTNKMHIF